MSKQPRWLEIRPVLSGNFKPGNFVPILEYLHNTGRPFRFCVVNCPSAKIEGVRRVRFFLQVEEELVDRVVDVLQTTLDVEVIPGSAPPEKTYEKCVELELRGHHALPLYWPRQNQEKPESHVDAIVAAISNCDSMIEVLAVRDEKARLEVASYVGKLTRRFPGLADVLLDAAIDVPSSVIFGPPPKRKYRREELSPLAKEKVGAACWKMGQKLLRCEIRIYGDSKSIEAVKAAMPASALNRLVIARRLTNLRMPPLRKPRGRELRRAILSHLWAAPLALYALLWYLGLVNPLALSDAGIFTLAATVGASIALWLLFPKKPALVLSSRELGEIVGLPTAVGRLPVEAGIARITKGLLTEGEQPAAIRRS